MNSQSTTQIALFRTCQGCGVALTYRGKGQPPKWCKQCKLKANLASVQRSYARRKKRLVGSKPVEEKRCIRCELLKPREAFARATSKIDGLQAWCRQCASEYQLANRAASNERLRRWRKRHPEYQGKYLKKARLEAIAHYSQTDPPSCACCGENEPAFLVIDHIHGGGGKERRELGRSLFPYLRSKGYPAGYQVLCWNCNSAKYYQGICPHKTHEQRSVCS